MILHPRPVPSRSARGSPALRRGAARTWVSLALLVLFAGAAAVAWYSRWHTDSTEAATAFMQRLVGDAQRGAAPGGTGGAELAELAQRAGGSISINVTQNGRELSAIVANDVGDRLRVALSRQGADGFRIEGVERLGSAPSAAAGAARPAGGPVRTSAPPGVGGR